MEFPLTLSFKFFALAPQITVMDAAGQTVLYIKQKLFKLREAVNVFSDATMTQQVATIAADRILDFSANYAFKDAEGQVLGGVRRKGMRSIWRAHYEVYGPDREIEGTIKEENPMAKVFDSLLSEIPVAGLLTGYFFHPKYLLSDANGMPLLRLSKHSAFLEGKFGIEQISATTPAQTQRNVLALLMLVLLERRRG